MTALADRPHSVYIIRDTDGLISYVGCTSNVRARLRDHRLTGNFRPGYSFEVESTHPDRDSGLRREGQLIFTHEPRGNRRGNPAGQREAWARSVLRRQFHGLTVARFADNDAKLWTALAVMGDGWVDDPDARECLVEYVALCAKTGCPVPGVEVKPTPWDLFLAEFEREQRRRTA